MAIKTEKELSEAIKNNQEYIEIEGSLADRTIKIKAVGKIAWFVAISSISLVVYAMVSTASTAGATTPATVPLTSAAFMATSMTIGTGAAVSSISIAVYTTLTTGSIAAGITALDKLRQYKIVSKSNDRIILSRKLKN